MAKLARSRNNIELRDEMNRLPDELLVSILSRLSLKEAAASSILCRRWRYLWTFTSKLDFDDGSDVSEDIDVHIPFRSPAVIPESWEYVGWVDTVLGLLLHDGSGSGSGSAAIEEFIISFGLCSVHKDHIDRWLKFALGRKVERLELNLRPTHTCENYKSYAFPLHLLSDSHSWGFKQLRQICMRYVFVSDEALEIFLRSCPLLEELSFDCCSGFSTIKIIGPIPAFKRLKIIYCQDLESVEIRDSNLVSLFYNGKKLEHFVLKNVPLLVEMGVSGMIDLCMEAFLSMFSSYLPQLEKLKINRRHKLPLWGARRFCSCVKMSNLKQLVWTFVGTYSYNSYMYGRSLMPLTAIIGTLPLLQRLVFMTYDDIVDPADSEIVISPPPQPQEDEIIYSRHLRQVEFAGYHSVAMELELLAHILENAAAVEELIIRPPKGIHNPSPPLLRNRRPYTEQETDAFRVRAKAQLTTILPPTVNLTIL